MERWFESLQPFATEKQELVDFVKERDGQVKVKIQIEHAQVEPDEEHVEQAEDELAKVLLVRWRDDLLQENHGEAKIWNYSKPIGEVV